MLGEFPQRGESFSANNKEIQEGESAFSDLPENGKSFYESSIKENTFSGDADLAIEEQSDQEKDEGSHEFSPEARERLKGLLHLSRTMKVRGKTGAGEARKLQDMLEKIKGEEELLEMGLSAEGEEFNRTVDIFDNLCNAVDERRAIELELLIGKVLHKALPSLEEVGSENEGRLKGAVKMLQILSMQGTSYRKQGIEALLDKSEHLETVSSKEVLRGTLFFGLVEGDEDQIDRALERIKNLLSLRDPKLDRFVVEEITQYESAIPAEGVKEGIEAVLGRYGLEYEDMIEAWGESAIKEKEIENIRRELRFVQELEAERPGIAQVLVKEFGVKNFARYPKEILFQQYDQKDNEEQPYGIILYPMSDWNGAFMQSRKVFQEFFRDLQETGYGARVVEARSRFGAARRIIALDKRYGESQKIAFAVVGGHGNWDGIRFGPDYPYGSMNVINRQKRALPRNRRFTVNNLADAGLTGLKRVSNFFQENPNIVLVSCTAGAERGIGREISRMGAEVIATNKDSNIKDLHARVKDGKIRLSARYKKSKSYTFVGGDRR